jgi:hypothetical protein
MKTRPTLVSAKATATELLAHADVGDDNAPSFTPTTFVEVAPGSGAVTALPAPPLMPDLAAVAAGPDLADVEDGQRAPSFITALASNDLGIPSNDFDGHSSGSSAQPEALRPTVRVGILQSLRLARMHRPTLPPTMPPPPAAAKMYRAA